MPKTYYEITQLNLYCKSFRHCEKGFGGNEHHPLPFTWAILLRKKGGRQKLFLLVYVS
jgi:hypothetical protein